MSSSSSGSLRTRSPESMVAESMVAESPRPGAAGHRGGEERLVGALRGGDERAFAELIDRHQGSMRRVARAYVPSDAVAEEVVQETWEAVLTRINRFEQRATIQTWI